MTYEELVNKISANSIPTELYSINEGIKPNAYILFKNYDKWEYFFITEKGDRVNFRIFYNESQAYDFFWEKLFKEISYPPSIPPQSLGI